MTCPDCGGHMRAMRQNRIGRSYACPCGIRYVLGSAGAAADSEEVGAAMTDREQAEQEHAELIGAVTIAEQIAEVRREIYMRSVVYASLIGKGKLRQEQADQRMRAMEAVLATLLECAKS